MAKIDEKFTGRVHDHVAASFSPRDEKKRKDLEDPANRMMELRCETDEAMLTLVATATINPRTGHLCFEGLGFCRGCLQAALLGLQEMVQIVEKIASLPEEEKS